MMFMCRPYLNTVLNSIVDRLGKFINKLKIMIWIFIKPVLLAILVLICMVPYSYFS